MLAGQVTTILGLVIFTTHIMDMAMVDIMEMGTMEMAITTHNMVDDMLSMTQEVLVMIDVLQQETEI